MDIIKVIPSGYCKGVINAINIVKQAITDYPDKQIYILGMLVHNKYVVEAFEKVGAITLQDKTKSKAELLETIEDGVVVFTAHGIDPKIKERAIEKGLIVVDATCNDVTRNSELCLDHLSQGYSIIYIGKRNHPESDAVVALSDKVHLVTNLQDIEELQVESDKLLITNQTTLSIIDIRQMINKLTEKFPNAVVAEEICSATRRRQNAIYNLKNVDTLVVVGDPSSNNTTQLAAIGKKVGISRVVKVENAKGLVEEKFNENERIAVTAGASTPSYLTNQVIEYLKSFNWQYLEIDLGCILNL